MGLRRGWPVLGLFTLLVACEADRGRLVVQVRSDLTPVLELTGVGVDLDGAGADGTWDAFVAVNPTQRWGAGVRVAEFTDLPPGATQLRVGAEGRDGTLLVERDVRVELRSGVNAVTVLLTRDCAGVECPASNPAETACLAGRCVRPECTEETPEACGARDCATPAECPAAAVACAEASCTASGACVEFPRDEACADAQVCSTRFGCVTTAGTVDAGTMDAGAADAGTPAEDAGPLTSCSPGEISLFGPPITDIRRRVALATDGVSLAIAAMRELPPAFQLSLYPLDGSSPTQVSLAATAGDESDSVDVEWGDVGGGRYEVAWVRNGTLFARAFGAEALADLGTGSMWNDTNHGAMSLAYNTRMSQFAMLVERDRTMAFIDLDDGVMPAAAPNARSVSTLPAEDPLLFWMSGLFAAVWTDGNGTQPVRFEGISPSGGSVGEIPLTDGSTSTRDYAGGWATDTTNTEFWIGWIELGGNSLNVVSYSEVGEVRMRSTRPLEGITEVEAAARPDGVGFVVVYGAPEQALVAYLDATTRRRVELTPFLDPTLGSAAVLFVDDLAYSGSAYYAAIRRGGYVRIVRICDE